MKEGSVDRSIIQLKCIYDYFSGYGPSEFSQKLLSTRGDIRKIGRNLESLKVV